MDAPPAGSYAVRFDNSQGQSIAAFSSEPTSLPEGGDVPFSLTLPAQPGAARVVLLRNGDLERRCPVDLLPDREAETLSAWLRSHPGVEIVTRDRSKTYARGISEGAPAAVQVADRWQLLKNLREALERLLKRVLPSNGGRVRQAAYPLTGHEPAPDRYVEQSRIRTATSARSQPKDKTQESAAATTAAASRCGLDAASARNG